MASALATVIWCSLAGAQPQPPVAEKPRLAVLTLEVAGGVEPAIGGVLSEAIAAEVAAKGYFQVVSAKDIQTMLGVERQRQLVGCSDEGSCLAELSGALGARFVLAGSVAKLGDAFQLTLQTQDSKKLQPVGRAVRIARGLEGLQAQLPYAVAEATATPPPPAPSHLMAYGAVGSGAALLIGGAVVGFTGLTEETALSKELSLGTTQPSVLKPVAYYQDAASRVRLEKSLAVVGLASGAALVGLGVFLNLTEGAGASVRVAVVPAAAGTGLALTGTLP